MEVLYTKLHKIYFYYILNDLFSQPVFNFAVRLLGEDSFAASIRIIVTVIGVFHA